MLRTTSRIFCLCLLSTLTTLATAQEKYEKEHRIDAEDAPSAARDFINKLEFTRKIKWFKEENLEGYTFEAKTCFEKRKHSIEFDRDGKIQDIEIIIKKDQIPAPVYDEITGSFQRDYDKFHISKIQVQYSGDQAALIQNAKDRFTDIRDDIVIHYEIVVHVKDGASRHQMEYLFNEKGQFIHRARIIHKNTDHLEF